MTAARAIASLVLFTAWSTMSSILLCVNAEEEAAADSAAEEAAARERIKVHDDKASAARATSEASNAKFLESFKNLQKQLDGWNAAIEAAGADADPVLVEKAANLEKDLKAMGVEYMKTVGTDELGDAPKAPDEQDTYGALHGWVVLSVKELGQQRLSTQKSLQMLADIKGDVVASDLAQDKLWKLVSVCIDAFTAGEYAALNSAFTAGRIRKLPDGYVEAANSPEAEQKLLEVSPEVWKVLQVIAKQVVEESQGEQAPAPPIGFGMLAAIPAVIGIGIMCRIYWAMKVSGRDKTAKKEKKQAKKSK